jgi:hypothetical protein
MVVSEDEIGICRFDPPKAMVVVADIIEYIQPQTAVHNWCGRHQISADVDYKNYVEESARMIRASDAGGEKE